MRTWNVQPSPEQKAEARQIATELAAIARTAKILPGTITERRTHCGRSNCRCHADPPQLHGPYWQWTRKIAAKTVGRWLNADQARDYQTWIDNDRRIRELLNRLEAIGIAAAADPPTNQPQNRPTPHTPVDNPRSTRR
jgi:hypothetical protein